VQASTHVNTGVQTSARMWLQTVKNWIDEILSTTHANPNYVDVGVQASPVLEQASRWQSFKDWVLDCFSMRSSEYSSIGMRRVVKWRNKLDPNQSVDLHDSESPLTTLNFETESKLQNLVDPNDSASQVSEVISESALQTTSNIVGAYDINYLHELEFLNANETVNLQIIDNIHYAVLTGNHLLTVDPSIFNLFI
jgi:hypothetical protein